MLANFYTFINLETRDEKANSEVQVHFLKLPYENGFKHLDFESTVQFTYPIPFPEV